MSQFKSFNIDDLYSFPGANAQQARAGAQGAQQPQPENEEFGVFDYAADAALGIPRGLLGGFSDIADLATMPFGYDVPDYFGLMEESKTVAGGITEGISSFMTGFIPGLGVASKLGKVGKIAGVVNKIDDIAAAAKLAGKTKKAAAISGAQAFVKGSVAGAIADFAAFDGHESRLSNLLQEYTPLRDPITSFLAADENDSEVVGRLKNAIEGLAIGGITEGLFNAIRLYKAGFVAKNGGRNVDEAIALEYVQIRREQRAELKESFNLSDEEAEAANILIDRMGIDRSRLRIVGGREAVSEYEAAAGTALEQRVKFDAKTSLDPNDPLQAELIGLLDDEEFASIRSAGSLASLVDTYKKFRDEVLPRLRVATEAGAAVEGGYLEGAEIMRSLVGDTRTELFAMFSAATSPQNKVAMHTRLGVALTADLIDRFRSGNFAELSVEEMTEIMKNSMDRVDAKGMANQYAKRAVSIANDLASRLRDAQAANPGASVDDLINGVDTAGLYKNMAGTDMAKGAGKVPGFAEGSAGRLNKPVLDTYMARLVPTEWFPNIDPSTKEGAAKLLDAKKEWLAKASNYTAFSANIRKLAKEMKIAPGNVQERAWGTIGVVSALLNAGATPDMILKNIDERDMLASWDLLSILQRQDVTNELKRLGADEGSLADLARIAADVRKRVRPNLGKPVSVSDTGKFEEFAGRVSDTARGAGSEVIAARKARGATLLRQETRRVTDRVVGGLDYPGSSVTVKSMLAEIPQVETLRSTNNLTARSVLESAAKTDQRWSPLISEMLAKLDADTLETRVNIENRRAFYNPSEGRVSRLGDGKIKRTGLIALAPSDNTLVLIHEVAHAATMNKIAKALAKTTAQISQSIKAVPGAKVSRFANFAYESIDTVGKEYLDTVRAIISDTGIDSDVRSIFSTYLEVAENPKFIAQLEKGVPYTPRGAVPFWRTVDSKTGSRTFRETVTANKTQTSKLLPLLESAEIDRSAFGLPGGTVIYVDNFSPERFKRVAARLREGDRIEIASNLSITPEEGGEFVVSEVKYYTLPYNPKKAPRFIGESRYSNKSIINQEERFSVRSERAFDTREEAEAFATSVSGRKFDEKPVISPRKGSAGRFTKNADETVSRGLPYGIANLDEFIAETLSNVEFQDLLRSMPDKSGKYKNLFESILSTLKTILGITGETESTMFDRAVQEIESIMFRDPESFTRGGKAAADAADRPGVLIVARGGEEVTGASAQSGVLRQSVETEVRGFASFSDDGKALIGGLSNPNVSTAIEEIGHVARRQLFDKTIPQSARMGISNADIDTIAKWSGAAAEGDNWIWDVDAEEKFAAGLLKYIRDGEAPAGLEGLFRKLSKWMVSLYRDIRGTDLDMKLSKEVRDVFDNLVERGPGFDAAGAAVSAAPVLRSTRSPTEVSPGSVGLGMPGGTPDKPINLERFSSIDEVNAEIDRVISEPSMAAAMDEDAQPLTEVVANAQKAYDSLVAATGEGTTIDFRKMLEDRTIGRWELQDAITQLQGLRKFAASAGNRLVELAKKGRASSPEEMYEFLAGRRALEVALLAIKERQREFARGLNAMNIVPEPDKAFTFMPSLPKPGEVVPPAGAATPPAGAVPPPAAGVPSPGTVAPEPAGAPRMPGEAPEGAVAPEAAPTAPAAPEAAPAVPEAVPAIDPLADPAARAEIIAKFIEQAGGIEAVQATMTRYAAAAASGGEDAVLRMARGQKGWMNALVEFWMNNILSGPVTHAVNASANMLTALYLPFERMLGATLRADMKTAQVAMRQYTYLFQQMGDALRIAGVALKLDENVLDTVVTKETQGRAISAAGLGMAEDTVGGMAANWIGKVMNIPTRLLSAEDEFFKQLNYRASFLSELYVDGLKKFKGDTAGAAKYAQETFNKAITDGQAYALDVVLKRAGAAADKAVAEGTITAADRGTFISKFMADKENWDPRLGAMSNRSLNNSRYATFSTPLSTEAGNPVTTRVAARFQAAANEHPVLRFVLPFIRTPTNLLNFTLERTLPLTAFSDTRAAFGEYGKLLNHKDAAVRADAMGRLAFSATVVSTVAAAAYAGTITGGGPKNAGERQTLQQAGWQPYSIKIGDTYYSYRREDPFASIIGLVADLMEGYKYAEERNMDTLGSATNTLVLAIARNVTNKTYLTGITNVSNALSNPEQFGPTLVNQYVSSLVPFSSALDQSKATVADDPILRDARNMLDAARAKVPFLAEGVTPRRNVLGEVMKKSEGLGPDIFSPIMYTQVTEDRILQEFGLLGHGFTPPKAMKGALDLTTFKTSGGQEAYDRWLELHGKVRVGGRSLRDELLRTINSPTYQQLSPDTTDDYDSPRVRVLRGIISKYREAAYKQLLKESPELNRASKLDYANKQALRMGRSAQELFDLANR